MDNSLKLRLQNDMKSAMKAHDKKRLDVIRYIMAAIKQQEVDKQIILDDTQILATLEKLSKQHRDSISQFRSANREDLVEKESFELSIVLTYLPEPLSETELELIIQKTIQDSGAKSIQDMGKVMNMIKPKVQGRADMEQLSAKIKSALSHA